MSLLSVVFRMLDKAGTGFIEPRREDGHGSHAGNLSHMQPHNTPEDPLYVAGSLSVTPVDLQQVADDYQTGEILPDQSGIGGVLTFTFSAPVQNLWVYAVNPLDLTDSGEVRVDPYGGIPSASLGIPVAFGGGFPISATTSSVKVFAPINTRVTVYGNRRA